MTNLMNTCFILQYVYYIPLQRREEKPTRCHWTLYCTYDMLKMFRALLCPSSGARDYMCVITAYGVQCLFAGCRGQMQGSRVASRKRDAAASLFLDAHPAALHLTPHKQQSNTAHHRRQIHTYNIELLMMGIEVPETCLSYHKVQ